MNFYRKQADFSNNMKKLKLRAQLLKAMRQFFDDLGFVEVETGILQTMPGADVHIHAFETNLLHGDLSFEKKLYLHNSPEFAMKKILVAGKEEGLHKIFQIAKVFRNGEKSKLHAPEFTMIEWYRSFDGYETIMEDCAALLKHIARAAKIDFYKRGEIQCNPFLPTETLRVRDAFLKFCGQDLTELLDNRESLAALAQKNAVNVRDSDGWDDIFFSLMAQKIEPNLGCAAPTILYEYPAHMAALSRICDDDTRFAKRFELYVCGVELANAFDELCNPQEQRARFEYDMAQKKKIYGYNFPIDEEFFESLEAGLPQTGGIALGVDRLIMLACNAQKIEEILWWNEG